MHLLPELRAAQQLVVFLAPSVPLVRQQADVLAAVPQPPALLSKDEHTPAASAEAAGPPETQAVAVAADEPGATVASSEGLRPALRVEWLGGSSRHEALDVSGWHVLRQRADVLVCTPAVLLGALVHAGLRVGRRWARHGCARACLPHRLIRQRSYSHVRLSLQLGSIGLLVLDEVHHCAAQHPYAGARRAGAGQCTCRASPA